MSDSPESLNVRTTLSKADWRAYASEVARRMPANVRTRFTALTLGLLVVGGVGAWYLARALERSVSVFQLMLGVLVFLLAQLAVRRIASGWYGPRSEGFVLGTTGLKFDASGIQSNRAGM